MKTLYIMRGCPGSGKSTLARNLQSKIMNEQGLTVIDVPIYSTDDFFMQNDQDRYVFDSSKLYHAHKWNQNRVEAAMMRGVNHIFVDNTNTVAKEAEFYVDKAAEFGYNVEVVEPNTSWVKDAEELHKRNTHGVPLETIKKMLTRYQSIETFKNKLNIK